MKSGIEEYVREGKMIPLDRPLTATEAEMREDDLLKHLYELSDEECREYFEARNRRSLMDVTKKRVENRNAAIRNSAQELAEKGIGATRDSYSKLEHTIDTFKDILDNKRIGSKELMFRMSAEKSTLEAGYPVIDDFILSPGQVVTMSRCREGFPSIERLNEFDNENKEVLGWTHSHGYLNTFFSGVDRAHVAERPTLLNLPLEYVFDNQTMNTRISYYPSIVVNNYHSEPFTTLSMDIPVYEVTGPSAIGVKEYRRIDIDDVPINLFGEDSYVRTEENTQEIREKLMRRVSLDSDGNYLGKLYDENFVPKIDFRESRKMSFAELRRRVEGPREEENQNYAPSSEQESSYASNYAATDDLESLDWDDLNFDEIDSLDDL